MFIFSEMPMFDLTGDDGENCELRDAALARNDPEDWRDVYEVQYYADVGERSPSDSNLLIL